MDGWAKTVVTGRARLGGVPVGVVAVETRSVAVETPADPADLLSEEKTCNHAGQVTHHYSNVLKSLHECLALCRCGIPIRHTKQLKRYWISTEKIFRSSCLQIGEVSLEE